MTHLERLVSLLRRNPDSQDRARAQQHVLDWVACAALGAQLPVGRKLAALWQSESEGGRTTALGLGQGNLASSVFFNGCLGNVLEMDDVHRVSVLHPGPIVIPAVLAVGEQMSSDGADILDAVILGYEAVIRVGETLGPDHYRYWHTTSTAGAFGAAVAAGFLRGLSDERMLGALGNVGTRTGGLWQMRHEACDSKQIHNGWAAQVGVQSAAAAAHGLRGPASALEGPQGLLAASAKGGLPSKLTAEPDARWKIWDCSFKPWAACRHAHPAIDAALKLQVDPARVRSIRIASYRDALTFCDRPAPETELAAKFSLQHAVAVTLLRGAPGLADFDQASRSDPAIATMRERSTVVLEEALDRVYPEHYGASVEVTLDDGQVLESSVRDTLGDPERPMTAGDLMAKYEALMAAAGYGEVARKYIHHCIDGIHNEGIQPLLSALRKPNNPQKTQIRSKRNEWYR